MKLSCARTGLAGLLFALLTFLSFQTWAQAVDHRPDPRQLFERMRLAGLLYSYLGSLTYEHDGQLSSFTLSSEGGEASWQQQIRSLSGPDRQFAQTIELCQSADLGLLRSRISRDTDELALSYNFQTRGETRVAGRPAQEILVLPADSLRYGYNFAVDSETGLMLHAMTLDMNRDIVERFQLIRLEAEPLMRDFQAMQEGCPSGTAGMQAAVRQAVPWELAWLPDGFDQIKVETEAQEVELVYSDGLAHFTLLIEPVAEVRFPPATTSFGATALMLNYYLVQGDTYAVTLVGEMPLATLQRIAASLHYAEPDGVQNDAG